MLSMNFEQVTKKILIVENNPRLIGTLLELGRRGYETVLARSGEEAVELAVSQQPDLIALDLTLPDMDGLEAARRIRQHPATCFIPILALTARSLSDDRKRYLQDGCEDFLYKPFANSLLASRVERLLE